MARSALEAVFGALGSGLVGYGKDQQIRYGREQDALEREERRKRTELADALQAASMLESGRWGTEAQLQGRMGDAGKTAMQAALFAASAGKGPPSAAPMPTAVARAVPQMARGAMAPKVSVGGQDLRLLESEPERQQFERAGRMEDAAMARQRGRDDSAAEFARAATQREREIRLQGEQTRRTNQERPTPTTGGGTPQRGGAAFLPEDIAFVRQFAPIRTTVNGKEQFTRPTRSLNSLEVKAAQSDLTNIAAGPDEQRYYGIAGAIADAKARRSEVGVLTENDIRRYREQVFIRPNDDIATQADKFRRLLAWADEANTPSTVSRDSAGIGTANPMGGIARSRLQEGRYP